MSTDVTSAVQPASFDLDAAWALHPQVAVRPERFGALLYHFGTRRLSFLKSPTLHTLVSSLSTHPSASAAIEALDVPPRARPSLVAALGTLAESGMIRGRTSK